MKKLIILIILLFLLSGIHTATAQMSGVSTDSTLPKQNPFHHAEKLPKLKNSDILALADKTLEKTKPGIDLKMQMELNKLLKDKSINLAGTGAFILASGGSPDAAVFLICKGILKKPKNPWPINDLGVYFRDKGDYPQSLQCYFYANSLDTGHAKVINANIGWASAYYGDFNTAKEYFDKALAIDKNYSEALEGEALIAYQQGDIKKLMACLAKELKFAGITGGAGNNGPSDAFVNAAMHAAMNAAIKNETNPEGQTQDPSNDHTFDNNNPINEGPPQDPPPGADVEPVSYPSFTPVFISDAAKIYSATVSGIQLQQKYMSKQEAYEKNLQKLSKSLKPLNQAPYVDDEGYLVYPNSFAKYVTLYELASIQFDQRIEYWQKKIHKDQMYPMTEKMGSRDIDMVQSYAQKLAACKGNKACVLSINCAYKAKLLGAKREELGAVSELWAQYYHHIFNTIQWYLDATAPFISRVHDVGWNHYLNLEREITVRNAVLGAYYDWIGDMNDLMPGYFLMVQLQKASCSAPMFAPIDPPKPTSKKPKHIKEYEGKCFDVKFGAFAELSCHGDKYGITRGPLSVFYSHTSDKIKAHNQGYTNQVGVDVSVSKDLDIVKVGEGENEKSLLSASAGVEGKVTLNFDNSWNFTSGSSGISASANLGSINLGSISATRTVEMVSGQLNVNPLSVTATGPLH